MENGDVKIHDYQIEKLLKDIEAAHRNQDSALLSYFLKATIKYVTRLLFSIGWSRLKNYANDDISLYIYQALFKDPKKFSSDTTEPGKFAHILKECAKRLKKSHDVQSETDLLYQLGNVRNLEAHEYTRIGTKEFYEDSIQAFRELEKIFQNKECEYIIPQKNESKYDISCGCFSSGEEYVSIITLPENLFEWIPKKYTMFYRITDKKTLETDYYCLSPFIEPPVNYKLRDSYFMIYDSVQSSGYGTDMDELKFNMIKPKETNNSNIEIEQVALMFKRDTLFNGQNVRQPNNNLWTQCINGNFVNISSYPGYGDVVKNKFSYCETICPVKANVLEFCKDRNGQIVHIVGNGGLGKTALIMHIINILITDGDYDKLFSNIIFLSAKTNLLVENKESVFVMSPNEMDISDYKELIEKLAQLTDTEYSGQVEDTADRVVEKVNNMVPGNNGKTSRRFLLIIDDMDSLSNEDQKLVHKFICRFDSQKLKTIITTRDIRNVSQLSPYYLQLKELDEEKSMAYAKWYVENKMDILWDKWTLQKNARQFVSEYGEGNPLTIQMLLTWVKKGCTTTYIKALTTRKERIRYMYNTVHNILSENDKRIFELCRLLYRNIPNKEKEMPVDLLEYLSAGLEITEDDFKVSVNELKDIKLIQISHNGFKPYPDFVNISESLPDKLKVKLPNMYQLFAESCGQDDILWFNSRIEDNMVKFIIDKETSDSFYNITAQRIFERILEKGQLSRSCENTINEWQRKHSENGEDEMSLRLIQQIEENYRLAENAYMNENLDDVRKLCAEARKFIRQLQEMQKTMKPDIKSRLITVVSQLNDFGC